MRKVRIIGDPIKRFFRYVKKTKSCWLWIGSKRHNGYGKFGVRLEQFAAHRWYFERINGKIPEKKQLDHLCRNRACVNPEHLEIVTNRENVRRGNEFRIKGCPRGHPYDKTNTYIYKDGENRHRQCKICRYARLKTKHLQRDRALATFNKTLSGE